MEHDLVLADDEVTLLPLSTSHAAALAELVDEQMWAGMTCPLPSDENRMLDYVQGARADPSRQAFAVVGTRDREVRGSTSFYEWVPSQQRIEIGHTFYGRRYWGGPTNPHAKLLLLAHAFDVLGCHRVALRCDSRNLRSAAALRRLGAVYEGTLRGHRVAADGSRGDTAYFSILADEWPAVRRQLQARTATQRA